jgi:hypothetical protein
MMLVQAISSGDGYFDFFLCVFIIGAGELRKQTRIYIW